MNEYERILEEAIDAFRGTPEELGALLCVATMTLPQRGWYSDEYVWNEIERKQSARKQIRSLPNGARILELEERAYR